MPSRSFCGSHKVNVAPDFASLESVSRIRSPPMSRASRRLIVSPSPVPPLLRVNPPSPCTNGSKTAECWSDGTPAPVSATRMNAHGPAPTRCVPVGLSSTAPYDSATSAAGRRELDGVGHEVYQNLPDAALVAYVGHSPIFLPDDDARLRGARWRRLLPAALWRPLSQLRKRARLFAGHQQPSCVRLCEIEHVVHESDEMGPAQS